MIELTLEEYQKLMGKLKNSEEERDILQKNHKTLFGDWMLLKADFEDLRNDWQKISQENLILKERRRSLEKNCINEIKVREEKISELIQEKKLKFDNVSLIEKNKSIRDELASLKRDKRVLNHELTELSSKLRQSNSHGRYLEYVKNQLDANRLVLVDEIRKLKETRPTVASSLSISPSVAKENESLKKKIIELKAEGINRLEQFDIDYKKILSENKVLESNLSFLNSETIRLSEECIKNYQTINKLSGEISEKNKTIDDLQKKLQFSNDVCKDKNKIIERLQQNRITLVNEIAALNKKNEPKPDTLYLSENHEPFGNFVVYKCQI